LLLLEKSGKNSYPVKVQLLRPELAHEMNGYGPRLLPVVFRIAILLFAEDYSSQSVALNNKKQSHF
jgi:hypothetical protein